MKNKINNILYILMLTFPLLDIITSLMTRFLDIRITLGLVVRGVLFIILVIYILFFSNSKYKKLSIIYFVSLLIYFMIYFLTKLSIFGNFNNIFTEVTYIFKYFYTIVIFIGFLNLFDYSKPNYNIMFKILRIELFIYTASIVLANITGTAFGTYVGGSGNTGWFYAGNEIGIISALLFPFLFLRINTSKSYSTVLYIIPIILGIEIIGTKTSMLGLLIPSLVFLFYYLIKIKKKFKQFIMTLLILIVIVVSSPALPVFDNIKNSIDRYVYRLGKTDLDDDYSKNALESVMFSDRDYYLKKTRRIYDKADISEKIFGIGFVNRKEINDKNIEKLIEMDFHDIFYHYGIVGFILYILPFIYFTFKIIIYLLRMKIKLHIKQLLLLYVSYIGMAMAALCGHVLGAPAVSFYMCISMVMVLDLLDEYYSTNLDEKEITILALHLGVGGIEKYISSLCYMLKDEYKINIISTYKIGDNPSFDYYNANIEYLIDDKPCKEEMRNAFKDKKYILTIKYFIKNIKLFIMKYVKNTLAINKINSKYVITTRTFHNRLVNDDLDRGYIKIATEHNYHNDNNKYIKSLVRSVKNFDCLVCVSDNLNNYYDKLLKTTKVVYIPNTIDKVVDIKNKKLNKNLIAVGRFSKEKGFDDLIDVFNLIYSKDKNARLNLIGDGKEYKNIKEKIINLNLDKSISTPGYISNVNELSKYYDNSSIYLMTSYTESFGLVLIEAMSHGLVCVGFDSADGAKTLLSKNGILISNRDKEKMADAVLKLLNDKTEFKKLSDSSIKFSKIFAADNIKNDWLKLLKNLNSN